APDKGQQEKIIGVKDFRDDSKDRFWVHIEGSMIDYIVDDETGSLLSGDTSKPESFSEIWSFIRGEKDWVLDEINQKAGIMEIENIECFSEEVKQGD
ncbi:MAG: hypothetical protein M1536_07620, partial [Firmicutes bacterium]|nr:hypothetical protein [Bacillota bacterium]